jgi:hypothetical protein
LLRPQGEVRKASSEPPEQPNWELTPQVTISAPTWLPESDKQERADLGVCDYEVPCEPCEDLLPNRLAQTKPRAVAIIDEEITQLRIRDQRNNALLVVGHQPQMGWLPLVWPPAGLEQRGRSAGGI